jgi:hypothetical protein
MVQPISNHRGENMKSIAVKMFDGMGRGIVARHDILRGDVVELAEILVLSEEDTVKVNQTDLQYYTFKYNDKQDCLVLGLGEIFNHSDKPNVLFTLVDSIMGYKMMLFEAMDDIKAGDQLFIDYGSDVTVDTTQYVNKNLI